MSGRRLTAFDIDTAEVAAALHALADSVDNYGASLQEADAETRADVDDATAGELRLVVTGLDADAAGALLDLQRALLSHPDAGDRPNPYESAGADAGPSIDGGDP